MRRQRHDPFLKLVRLDNRDKIPGPARRNSEGCSWVTQPTRSRKGDGQHSLLGKRETREGADNVVPQDPRRMAKAALPEVQSYPVHRKTHRYAPTHGDPPLPEIRRLLEQVSHYGTGNLRGREGRTTSASNGRTDCLTDARTSCL